MSDSHGRSSARGHFWTPSCVVLFILDEVPPALLGARQHLLHLASENVEYIYTT